MLVQEEIYHAYKGTMWSDLCEAPTSRLDIHIYYYISTTRRVAKLLGQRVRFLASG